MLEKIEVISRSKEEVEIIEVKLPFSFKDGDLQDGDTTVTWKALYDLVKMIDEPIDEVVKESTDLDNQDQY